MTLEIDWKLVPVPATPEMLEAGCDRAHGWPTYADQQRSYQAMVDKAPVPPFGIVPPVLLQGIGADLGRLAGQCESLSATEVRQQLLALQQLIAQGVAGAPAGGALLPMGPEHAVQAPAPSTVESLVATLIDEAHEDGASGRDRGHPSQGTKDARQDLENCLLGVLCQVSQQGPVLTAGLRQDVQHLINGLTNPFLPLPTAFQPAGVDLSKSARKDS